MGQARSDKCPDLFSPEKDSAIAFSVSKETHYSLKILDFPAVHSLLKTGQESFREMGSCHRRHKLNTWVKHNYLDLEFDKHQSATRKECSCLNHTHSIKYTPVWVNEPTLAGIVIAVVVVMVVRGMQMVGEENGPLLFSLLFRSSLSGAHFPSILHFVTHEKKK
jgi:hypothetical protein